MTSKQLARFIATIRFEEIDPELGECWVWTGQRTPSGYGRVSLRARGPQSKRAAHRMAYEHWVGAIADGLCLDHLCRTRACVNPRHLDPVSTKENILRGLTGRYAHSREHNAKIAATKVGRQRAWTPEWRAKLRAGLTIEGRQKMADAARRFWTGRSRKKRAA